MLSYAEAARIAEVCVGSLQHAVRSGALRYDDGFDRRSLRIWHYQRRGKDQKDMLDQAHQDMTAAWGDAQAWLVGRTAETPQALIELASAALGRYLNAVVKLDRNQLFYWSEAALAHPATVKAFELYVTDEQQRLEIERRFAFVLWLHARQMFHLLIEPLAQLMRAADHKAPSADQIIADTDLRSFGAFIAAFHDLP